MLEIVNEDQDIIIKSFANYCSITSCLISDLKYNDKVENVTLLSKFLYLAYQDFAEEIDLIIPIPMHWSDFYQRKYNHIGIIAKKLSILANKQMDFNSLVKIKKTKKQVNLSKKERMVNLKNAFTMINKKNVIGKKILLIDDVVTTGSTLTECAKILLKNGASKVLGLTISSVK
ncbi:ComF family protein [Candidatus Cyrtobacter comes]|nr:ComF family protein [Candidatus Cyrtobacter comes]